LSRIKEKERLVYNAVDISKKYPILIDINVNGIQNNEIIIVHAVKKHLNEAHILNAI
jgi:hypothetical protein